MKRSASSIDKTVRPNGPVEVYRFFQSEYFEPVVLHLVGRKRATNAPDWAL
jgi:hypothetical protein